MESPKGPNTRIKNHKKIYNIGLKDRKRTEEKIENMAPNTREKCQHNNPK
jgi:hypothetical protein